MPSRSHSRNYLNVWFLGVLLPFSVLSIFGCQCHPPVLMFFWPLRYSCYYVRFPARCIPVSSQAWSLLFSPYPKSRYCFLATLVKMLNYRGGQTPIRSRSNERDCALSSLPTCANDLKINFSDSLPADLMQHKQPHGFRVIFPVKDPSLTMLPIPLGSG